MEWEEDQHAAQGAAPAPQLLERGGDRAPAGALVVTSVRAQPLRSRVPLAVLSSGVAWA